MPKDWIAGPARKGDGMRYLNPHKPGDSIIIENGTPGVNNVPGGPYVKMSSNGKVERIPLAGNPVLKR
jgi:hypothetical protein